MMAARSASEIGERRAAVGGAGRGLGLRSWGWGLGGDAVGASLDCVWTKDVSAG